MHSEKEGTKMKVIVSAIAISAMLALPLAADDGGAPGWNSNTPSIAGGNGAGSSSGGLIVPLILLVIVAAATAG
jgi:hypothetical protein